MRRTPAWPAALLAASLSILSGCQEDSSTSGPAPAPTPTPDPAPSGPITVRGDITEDTTWVAEAEYILDGPVVVADGATLTIEPGTHIYGQYANDIFVVARGGTVMAEGTAEAPIVFTSAQLDGERRRGDWGGVVINGAAPINIPGNEAVAECVEAPAGIYGGNDPADSSGVLRYVRVEFAGGECAPDFELNGIAFHGVGRGTEVDFIQVHFAKDDGIEFFGGTVDARHIVVTGAADDSFDWTDGWTGRGQFWIAQQRGDDADQGIEADNNGENNDLTPRSAPTLYNLTLIGDPDTNEGDESDIGMLLREGTAAEIGNAIVIGFKETGLDIDNAATYQNAKDGALVVRNSIFYNNLEAAFDDDSGEDPAPVFSTRAFAAASEGLLTVDPDLADPYNHEGLDCRPGAGSVAFTNYALPPNDGFFQPVTYVGACDGADQWTAGWTTFVRN